jgi:hypothetical protein
VGKQTVWVDSAGAGLLMKTVDALARALGHWLTHRPAAKRSSVDGSSPARGTAGARRQARHRRRGGWG